MPYNYAPFVRKVFEDTGPNNPLRKLSDDEKRILVALVQVYLAADSTDGTAELLDEIAAIASEASVLANRMRTLVFGGQLAEPLSPLVGKFKILPSILEAFSSQTAWLVNQTGKPGQKGKLSRNSFLIIGSEFVCAVAGSHYDEHLAEVIQSVSYRCNSVDVKTDISGDSIRKKREHLKKSYPAWYSHFSNAAGRMRRKRSAGAPGLTETDV